MATLVGDGIPPRPCSSTGYKVPCRPLVSDHVVVNENSVLHGFEHCIPGQDVLSVEVPDVVVTLRAVVLAAAPEVIHRFGHERRHESVEATFNLGLDMVDHHLEQLAVSRT